MLCECGLSLSQAKERRSEGAGGSSEGAGGGSTVGLATGWRAVAGCGQKTDKPADLS